MKEARLVVDATTVLVRSSGPATGDIALVIGGITFPGPGWNDFVIVILGAWLSALARLVRKESAGERVHFMEGPFAVDMKRLENGTIRLRALERPDGERAVLAVPPLALVENAVAAADDVLRICRDKAHRSDDVDQLEATTMLLREEVRKLRNYVPQRG